jgi:radical SAM superfamily enzyme YgiQ (UPF0313 family)
VKRKKVVLYNPKAVFFDMPLALMAIGSALEADRYEVVIIDGRVDAHPLERVLEAAEGAVCLGITALTGNPLHDALAVTRAAKARFPGLPVVWGGWHASLFGEETLQEETTIDVTVQGQGEITFQELVQCLDAGSSLESVSGICYRSPAGTIHRNPARALAKMDTLPAVNYRLISPERYFSAKKRRQLDYISSTGCHFRCTFCADPFVYQRSWTGISPARMGEELTELHREYGFTDLNFQDETFFTRRERVTEIAEIFLRNDLHFTWAGTMRADQGARLSDADLDLCRKAGLRRVLIGVESGSQEMMDWMKKDIKLEQVLDTARRCAERGIDGIFPFIVGFPNETDASLLATLKVARTLSEMHPGFSTPIFYFKPYPGSAITQELVAGGYTLPQTLEEWAAFDYVGTSGPWVSAEKYRLIERFKFYNRLATKPLPLSAAPVQWMARQRLDNHYFGFPWEKMLADTLMPRQRLS